MKFYLKYHPNGSGITRSPGLVYTQAKLQETVMGNTYVSVKALCNSYRGYSLSLCKSPWVTTCTALFIVDKEYHDTKQTTCVLLQDCKKIKCEGDSCGRLQVVYIFFFMLSILLMNINIKHEADKKVIDFVIILSRY